MTEYQTVLPATADDALAHVRAAATDLTLAEDARANAIGDLREAVVAARVMRVSWDSIARELGVTRQAAAERFGGDIRAELVSAWFGIERLLARLAEVRRYSGQPVAMLKQLGQEGAIPADVVDGALQLYQARSAVVHASTTRVALEDAERLTDIAIPLVGMLWLLLHAEEPDQSSKAANH